MRDLSKQWWRDYKVEAVAVQTQYRRSTTTTLNLNEALSDLIIDGPLTFPPVCWRARHGRIFMSRWPCVLFHFHRRSVLLDPRHSYILTPGHLETIASMFCKSCNCNSSIATRIGFAVRSCYSGRIQPFSRPMLDDIRAHLHACVAYEDTIHDPTY
jgi:hypothetical protein